MDKITEKDILNKSRFKVLSFEDAIKLTDTIKEEKYPVPIPVYEYREKEKDVSKWNIIYKDDDGIALKRPEDKERGEHMRSSLGWTYFHEGTKGGIFIELTPEEIAKIQQKTMAVMANDEKSRLGKVPYPVVNNILGFANKIDEAKYKSDGDLRDITAMNKGNLPFIPTQIEPKGGKFRSRKKRRSKKTRKNKRTKKNNRGRKSRSKKQGGAKMPYVGRYYENPNAKLWDGVYEHDYKMVEEAFKEGADVNIKNDNGVWFLLVASENGNARMVNLLLEKGIDVNITDDYNNTALSTAVRNAKYDVVELLLEKGADINKENNKGDTPLMHAIIFEDYDMVELLLEHPDIDIELDLATNKELQLAEDLWDDMTPEEQEENGIPYAIEYYLRKKNDIKEKKDDNIKELSNYTRPNVPKLSTLAHRHLSTLNTIKYNNAVKDNTVPPLDGKLGGKRKTRKKRRINKKSKK
jgi:hypothetical protein